MKKLGLALLAIVLVAGAVVAMGAISQKRKRLQLGREIAALKEAYLALAMYRSDYGQFPPRLADLVPQYLPEEAYQNVASCQYSPQTPDRLLVRRGAVVHADGSGRITRE